MTTEPELLSPGLDYVFKLIFGDSRHADVTKDFLASVLNLPDDELASLTFTNTELKREHKDDKKGILDVRITTAKGTDINIEIQIEPDFMAERSLYYWSKMFATHLEKNQGYGDLIRTISISILHFNLFKYPRHHSTFHIREDNENIILTDLLRLDFLELLKIKKLKGIAKDKTTQWMQFLTTKDKEVLTMLSQENPSIGKAVGILKTLSGDEKVRMEAFYREKEIRDEISKRKAYEKKIEISRAEGKAEGRAEGKLETAANLLKMGLTVEQIQTATGLTEEEILSLKQ